VFIIDFDAMDIYDEEIKVFLFKKLREQIRFRDKEKLKLRIAADVDGIRDLLRNKSILQ